MKVMVAFLGKKKNKRYDYLEEIKKVHKNNKILDKKKVYHKELKLDLKNKSNNINKFKFYNKEKEIKKSFSTIKLTTVFCVIIMLMICKFPSLKVRIANLATNFRQADKIKVEMSDVISTASLFNKDNYIVTKQEKDLNENIEVTEVSIKSEESQEYKAIDEQTQKYDVEQVLSKNVSVNITTETATVQKLTVDSVAILNYSSNRNIDFESIMKKEINLTKKSDKILLYNTHTSESYTNSENYQFEYSSTMRSLDAKYNMLAIAKELNENLIKKGFISIQNTTPHDYGAYTGAYTKSRATVTNELKNNGGAGIIIDVHRDAMADLTYRPVANINGVQVSQLMFVVGIGTGENEYWEDNLRLALKLQQIANKIYPGLFRQMIIRDSTYNQDLNRYSLLIEFGATGNTIDEVKLSTRCVSNLLNIIYKD